MPKYTNSDNMVVQVGRQGTFAGNVQYQQIRDSGSPFSYLIIDWRYNSLPGFDQDTGGGATPDSFSEAIPYIPANSMIRDAYTIITTAFAGGTSFVMGTYQKGGTVIDADGIYTGTELALAGMNAAGKIMRPDGVLVRHTTGTFAETTASATLNSYILVTATGTFTAGRARTVIEYILPGPGL